MKNDDVFIQEVEESIRRIQDYSSKKRACLLGGFCGLGAGAGGYSFLGNIVGGILFYKRDKQRQLRIEKEEILIKKSLDELKSIVEIDSEIDLSHLCNGFPDGFDSKTKFKIKEDVLKAICPALESLTKDAVEIAKVTTPILLSLSLVGTIVLPVSPMVFALISILISKAEVASVCHLQECSKKEE